jgi:hypothetical protein
MPSPRSISAANAPACITYVLSCPSPLARLHCCTLQGTTLDALRPMSRLVLSFGCAGCGIDTGMPACLPSHPSNLTSPHLTCVATRTTRTTTRASNHTRADARRIYKTRSARLHLALSLPASASIGSLRNTAQQQGVCMLHPPSVTRLASRCPLRKAI